MTRQALIAGAGIAGLTTALCLARSGWSVRIFERAPTLEEAGAGLQVSPNASAVLRDLGLLKTLAALATRPHTIHIRHGRDGRTLARMPLDDAERRWGAPYLLVHRADLQKILLDVVVKIGIVIETGVTIQKVGDSGGAASLQGYGSGPATRTHGDLVIGADGLRSAVRAAITPARERYSGRTAWRALVPTQHVAAAMRQPATSLWLGRRAHLVHYPLRNDSLINLVAIIDDTDSRESDDFWSSPGDPRQLMARFADWSREARDLLAAAEGWRRWPLFDAAPLPRWTRGRLALVGDAAHPILPFLAQGAAQAIEDAAALGDALSHETVERGLARYEALRRARATRVQTASRRLGAIYHLAGPAALARDFVIGRLGAAGMLARYDWLYDSRASARPG